MSGFKFDNRTGTVSFNEVEVLNAATPVVTSVNGLGGAVVLTAASIDAVDVAVFDQTVASLTVEIEDKADTASLAPVATSGEYADLSGTPVLGSAAGADVTDFATAAQGALADTAVQSADLSAVATSGAYGDLTGTPTLGTASAASVDDFATAAQGALADTAVQPEALAAVATSGSYLDLTDTPVGLANTFYVATNGSDSVGTGAVDKPFATPQAAHDHIVATVPAGNFATVVLSPGTYPALTVTRARTAFVGYTGQNFSTNLRSITVDCTLSISGSVDNTVYTFENLSVLTNAGIDCVLLSGTEAATLILTNVRVYSSVATNGRRGVTVTNTATTQNKIRFTNVDVNTKASNGTAFQLFNVQGFMNTMACDSANGLALGLVNSFIVITTGQIECASSQAIVVGTDSQLVISNSTIRNNTTDANIVVMQDNGIMSADGVTFLSDGTSGLAVAGTAPAVVQYGAVLFASPTGGAFTSRRSAGLVMVPIANEFTT